MNKKNTHSRPKRHVSITSLIRTLLVLLAVSPMMAWHEVGNGGDPIRLLFSSARERAAVVVARMHPDAFTSQTPDDVRSWLLKNKVELAADILRSQHDWLDTAEATCAHTAVGAAGAVVELSYPTCRLAIHDVTDASFTLIHEAVHHFGISDESYADQVASAVINALKSGILDWQPIAAPAALAGRSHHSAVWTGSKMIVFGGVDQNNLISSSGAIFDPSTNQWTMMRGQGAPSRAYHEAIWTGSKMIVWGGLEANGAGPLIWAASGAIYDPATDSWSPIRSRRPAGVLVPNRTNQTVVWTGNRMIVWGGYYSSGGRVVAEGGIYDPSTDSWKDISTAGAALRYSGHSAVWTGSKMIVWGGKPFPNSAGSAMGETNEGAIYDPYQNSWTAISLTGAPTARNNHTAVWADDRMIVFGGQENAVRSIKGSGGIYDPASGTWQAYSLEMAPQRIDHSALWSGGEMLIFGGKQSTSVGSFNLVTCVSKDARALRAISGPSAPSPRSGHSAVWTGMSMIVFGGILEDGRRVGDGGLFYP